MNRAAFFAALQSGALFGSRLTRQQVEGTEAILDAASRHGMTNSQHVANVLAQVYHETSAWLACVRRSPRRMRRPSLGWMLRSRKAS